MGRRWRVWVGAVAVFLGSAALARAGYIVVDPDVRGIGGAGGGKVVTKRKDNDNTRGPSTNTIVLSETFERPGQIEAFFAVADTKRTTEYFAKEVAITNNSKSGRLILLERLVFELGFDRDEKFNRSIGGDGLDFDATSYTPVPTGPPGFGNEDGRPIMTEDVLTYTGVILPPGEPVKFTFSIDVPNGISGFTLRTTPFPAPAAPAIPEPASLALAGRAAAAGLGYARRRRA